jgi:DNA-binding NarL/FixJ family response regulator
LTNLLQKTLLVVDDNPNIRNSMKLWLSNEGFRVLTASNGVEALDRIANHPVDVILVDFKLEIETGIEITEKIKEISPELPVIMLTGFPSYETAVKAMKVGIYDYISKDEENDRILDVISRAIEDAQNMRKSQAGSSAGKVPIILACGHSLIRESLESFSSKQSQFNLVKSVSSLDYFNIQRKLPAIDIALICAPCSFKKNNNPFNKIYKIQQALPGTKLVIINENLSEEEKIELLKMGIRGFFSRDLDSEQMHKALQLIHEGEIWASRKTLVKSVKDAYALFPQNLSGSSKSFKLTIREQEILKALSLGLSNKDIAEKLFISESTVKTHVNRVFKKLGVKNRASAILVAMETNQLPKPPEK